MTENINNSESDDLKQILKSGRPNDAYNIGILATWVELVEHGGSINSFFEDLQIKTCAIYGAGVLGRTLLHTIDTNIVEVKYIIDRVVEELEGYSCVKPAELLSNQKVEVVIITPGFDMEVIRPQLAKLCDFTIGIDSLCRYRKHDLNTLVNALVEGCSYDNSMTSLKEKDFRKTVSEYVNYVQGMENIYLKEYVFEAIKKIYDYDVVMPNLDLVLTTRCTLKCKYCNHLIPLYTQDGRCPFDIMIEDVLSGFDLLMESVDYIPRISIMGGEPFLYNELIRVISHVLNSDKIGFCLLVTNGTIIPSDDLCKLMSNDRISVYIDDYDVKIGKIDAVVEKLKQYGVKYTVNKLKEWYDFGNPHDHKLNENELKVHYQKCDYSNCYVLMGDEMHTCGYIKHGQHNGVIPEDGEELKLGKYDRISRRKEIVSFMNKEYFSGCNYCNGAKRCENGFCAGEQSNA